MMNNNDNAVWTNANDKEKFVKQIELSKPWRFGRSLEIILSRKFGNFSLFIDITYFSKICPVGIPQNFLGGRIFEVYESKSLLHFLSLYFARSNFASIMPMAKIRR